MSARRALTALAVVGCIALGAAHAVETEVTPADADTLAGILAGVPRARSGVLADDIATIRAVQAAVLQTAPIHRPIPHGQTREPADLVRAAAGLCYDRSRTIEKALRLLGFDVRHVFLLSTAEHSPLAALVTPGVESHAVTEVETVAGWLVVDSNAPWISVDRTGRPVSMADLQDRLADVSPVPDGIYREPVWPIYGLYSRHVRFFPPFNGIPDVIGANCSAIWSADRWRGPIRERGGCYARSVAG